MPDTEIKQVQRRRGTTIEHAEFTGAPGEITVDTEKNTVVVHDGFQPGGYPMAKEGDIDLKLATRIEGVQSVASLRVKKGMQPGQAVEVVDTERAGLFRWDAGDLSAEVAADPGMNQYVPPAGQNGSAGAWVRVSGDIAGLYPPESVTGSDYVLKYTEDGPRRVPASEVVNQSIESALANPLPDGIADASSRVVLRTSDGGREVPLQDAVQAGWTDTIAAGAAWFPDIAAGIAGTSEGDYFSTPSDSTGVAVVVYRHDPGGIAEVVSEIPSASKVQSLSEIVGYEASTDFEDYSRVDADEGGLVTGGLRRDGTYVMARMQIGGGPEGTAFSAGSRGLEMDGTLEVALVNIPKGKFKDAAFIDCDAELRVVAVVYHDGRVETTEGGGGGGSSLLPGESVLLEQTMLPNGALAENASGGFTCTGLDRMPGNLWVVGNHGKAKASETEQTPSIVILTPDCRYIFREIPCTQDDFPGIESIQGVTYDSSDNTIWFADKSNNIIRHISATGQKLSDEIACGFPPNGIAYDRARDVIWAARESGGRVYIYSCSDGSLVEIVEDAMPSGADQLHYEDSTGLLYATYGANGVDGMVGVYDTNSRSRRGIIGPLKWCQAIEGIFVEGDRMYLTNDGGYHTNATPPLSMLIQYEVGRV